MDKPFEIRLNVSESDQEVSESPFGAPATVVDQDNRMTGSIQITDPIRACISF